MVTSPLSITHNETFNTMARLQELTYIVDIEEVALPVGLAVPSILPSSISLLLEDIKQSALMHACAWLSDGGVKKWKYQSVELRVQELTNNILRMATSFQAVGTAWQLDTTHQMPTTWAISMFEWARAIAAFAIKLSDTILSQTVGLVEFAERFNEHTLFFTPQRIWNSGGGNLFTFRIALFSRELLQKTLP